MEQGQLAAVAGERPTVRASAEPLSLGRCARYAVDLFPIGEEGADCFVDVFLEGYLPAADLPQRRDRGLVGAGDGRPGPAGQLAGPFCSQDAESEVVVHTLETIFDRNSCHGSSPVLSASARARGNGGL